MSPRAISTLRLSLDQIELGPSLGVGTVGAVYRGRLLSSGETVAVKILQTAVSADALVRSRFEREMVVLERLEHPNIIRYFGGGEDNGRLFYAMELVEGGTLRELLQRCHQLSVPETLSIGRQLCSALQYAHNHGVIHRDVKPSNLFLTLNGQVKLGDFGIARDTHQADITHQGFTVGTHAYMAPEQITGDGPISGKADLYAVGCVLFELLAGRTPFQGVNFAQLFEGHLRQPPPKLASLVDGCPPQLSVLVDQLLAKSPDQRPFNARAVQAVLMRLGDQWAADHPQWRPADRRQAAGAARGGEPSDVGAADAVDLGSWQLSHRLTAGQQPRVINWPVVVGLAAGLVLLVAWLLWQRSHGG